MKRAIKKHGTKLRAQFQYGSQYPSLIWDKHGQTQPPRITGVHKGPTVILIENVSTVWKRGGFPSVSVFPALSHVWCADGPPKAKAEPYYSDSEEEDQHE